MAVIVRKATFNDMPELLEMGERFVQASGYGAIGEYDSATVQTMFTNLMADDSRFLAVVEDGPLVGMLGAVVQPVLFNHRLKVCQEIFWWVEAAYRQNGAGGALVEALETFAAEQECSAIFMASLTRHRGASEFYGAHGYECAEQTFFKALN